MAHYEQIANRRQEIINLAGRYGASNIRIFGSVARKEAGPESDIDFLVDLEPGRSLLDLSGLLLDLQTMLGQKVDVVTENGLHWYIREKILAEAKIL